MRGQLYPRETNSSAWVISRTRFAIALDERSRRIRPARRFVARFTAPIAATPTSTTDGAIAVAVRQQLCF